MRIELTGIFVDSPTSAFAFYTEKLGFIEKLYMPENDIAIVASPEHPNGTSLLLEPKDSNIARDYQEGLYEQGIPAIVFGVNDIHKEYRRLKDMGVKFRKEPAKNESGWEAVFDDTCGNWIQLYQV